MTPSDIALPVMFSFFDDSVAYRRVCQEYCGAGVVHLDMQQQEHASVC